MTDLTNSLADLAERIREANEASIAAEATAIEKALVAGRLLCDAKEACAHGEWGPFLGRAGVHERQARRLMQIARSGLKADAVSEIGGIKATLEWLGKRVVPAPDEVVFVCREDADTGNGQAPIACILPSEVEGFYDVSVIGPEGCTFTTTGKPVKAEAIRLGDGSYFSGLWETVARSLEIPIAEWTFTAGPIYLVIDDCSFLADMVEAPISTKKAPLPHSYAAMVEALEQCVADFTAERYFKARRLQKLCFVQMNKWPSDPRMLHTFARIAGDSRPQRLAAQVDALAKERLVA
ncbi:hypothetical protein [Mesorhizobium sp. CN2-181]|uniref:hypothetical protein n=1 Tax=Mesorhizobium yinganensis TaxID=3157707 RepID=UPI0032B7044F